MKKHSSSEREKIRLEHNAAKIFMRKYEKLSGKKIRHIWHNDPRKPDVSCRLEGERLDIEVAHLYGSHEEAMQILGKEVKGNTLGKIAVQEGEMDVQLRILKALNDILEIKAKKEYHSSKVWLVIRNAHPAWNLEVFKGLRHCVNVPDDHAFDQIWMVTDMSQMAEIVRLYP